MAAKILCFLSPTQSVFDSSAHEGEDTISKWKAPSADVSLKLISLDLLVDPAQQSQSGL